MFSTLTAEPLRKPIADLASANVYVGTSSWKYPGWLGQVYSPERYATRGKFSKAKFDKECLAEYAEMFPTVCVDAGYYKFPDEKYLSGLCSQVPHGFKFGFKVTDTITIKHYTNLPRFGNMAGKDNHFFLDPILFQNSFLRPWEKFREKLGVLIFEFSHFHQSDYQNGRDFIAALDTFLSQLPKDWPYSVEVRNKNFLHPEYFAMLRSHGVAHVFNNWSRMPEVAEQMNMEGSITTDFTVARFLLKPGRTYEQAVKEFEPYEKTKELNESARAAGRSLIQHAKELKSDKPSFVYINNRLEGNAPSTIAAMIKRED